MHPLLARREQIRIRIVDGKKEIRRIRVRIGADVAALLEIEARCRAAGLLPGEEETHGRPPTDPAPRSEP